MKAIHLTKPFAFLLAVTILTAFAAISLAENPELTGEGTVIISDTPVEDIIGGEDQSEPFIPEGTGKSIFGDDGRIMVSETSVYPYSAIAYMACWGNCECDWTANGYLIGPDRLLTAAHCLVCPKHGKWAKKIVFYFGYRNSRNYLVKYTGSWSAVVGNGFSDNQYSTHGDYGCVKLNERVGDQVGWYGTWWNLSDRKLAAQHVYLAGYKDGELMYDSGTVSASSREHLSYTIDMLQGTSGCPIFTSDYYAVGINIAENSHENIGYRLNRNVKDGFSQLD